jgi:tRNA threonylcarbamoyladenosine biosynthesis protein TsaE
VVTTSSSPGTPRLATDQTATGRVTDPLVVETPDGMRALGGRIAEVARPGDLVVLAGPLGAGKTVLVQGIAAGLGVRGPVTSPTFVLARVHSDGRLPLVHVDAYRLGGVAEVDDLDLDADTDVALTVVEWGAGRVEQLAQEHLRVEIERPEGDEAGDARRVRLVPTGPGWSARIGPLLAADAPAR